MSVVSQIRFVEYEHSVAKALDHIQAHDRLPQDGLILIKPNLTTADKPPVTTPVQAAEAVFRYCRAHTHAEIALAEGCGSGVTRDTFEANGYTALCRKYNLRLIDFNQEDTVALKNPDALLWKELHLPRIALDAFIISLPILKDHSFTRTTICMKNMFGLAPAPHYKGSWNKSKLHSPSTHKSVVDVCLYKPPGLCVVDASVALTGMHLSGTPKALGLILASLDPVAIDAVGSRLLGHNPQEIEYLRLAQNLLGDMTEIQILEG